jgi:hypothetical protein
MMTAISKESISFENAGNQFERGDKFKLCINSTLR